MYSSASYLNPDTASPLPPGPGSSSSSFIESTHSPVILLTTLQHVHQNKKRTVRNVLLCAPTSPRDIMTVRNELARLEAANGINLLDEAASLFGGTANWHNSSEFHAKNTSNKVKKAKESELEVYGHLAYASAMGHPLLIIGTGTRTYIHLAKVAYIVDESDHGLACQFSIILNTKLEYKFICNSSAEYLQWIDALQQAYKVSHPSSYIQNGSGGYMDEYDDRRSIASQNSVYSSYSTNSRRPKSLQQPQRSTSRNRQPEQMMRRRATDNYNQYQQQYYPSPQQPRNGYSPAVARDMSTRRSMPVMQQQRYYESEDYYSRPPRGGPSYSPNPRNPSMHRAKSADRFRLSTRPTKLDPDDDFSEEDEEPYPNPPIVARSSSVPARSAMSGKQRDREMSVEEVYELTVNAYKAGLADDDDRETRNQKRFSAERRANSTSGMRAGYPTRTGSVVRFTGEDEVAYDLKTLGSDSSRASSVAVEQQQRRGGGREEYEAYQREVLLQQQMDLQAQKEQQAKMKEMSRQNSSPMGRSKTVDGRYGAAAVTVRSTSVGPALRSPSSPTTGTAETKSITSVTSTTRTQRQQPPMFTMPSMPSAFRMNSKDSATDSLFESNKEKRARESLEQKSKPGPKTEKMKQYVLSALGGAKLPSIPSLKLNGGNSSPKPVERSMSSSSDTVVSETKTTTVTSSEVVIPVSTPAELISPGHVGYVSETETSLSRAHKNYEAEQKLKRESTNETSTTTTSTTVAQMQMTDRAVVASPQVIEYYPPIPGPPRTSPNKSPIDKEVPPVPTITTASSSFQSKEVQRRLSIASSSSSESSNFSIPANAFNLSWSPYTDLFSDSICVHMHELRKGVGQGNVGATASIMGIYSGVVIDDEMNDSDSSAGGMKLKSNGTGTNVNGKSPLSPSTIQNRDGSSKIPISEKGASTTTTSTTVTTSTIVADASPTSKVVSPRRSGAKMSENAASLGHSLMAALQSSAAYQNASRVKSDAQVRKEAAESIKQTLQKMEPVVQPSVTKKASVSIPAADSGGIGAVRNAIGAFEQLKGGGSSSDEEPLQKPRRRL
ncbi:hypothetical protein BCR33DRAFT_853904 [Rhizoclosmatium globosum]|uniref:PH domain-containing protein n=1 Tax=Rhizoclosmatium globosum TaxID=329046 RepID=A0A1Y2BUX1_9FUNG|nr:hypothetical protein BCR33DRAFT_853904 [Rhizoclosmatium globosum]|eukprot:ORY38560.1 hypothetical protein BCR33DRAFT_853904 [Rhizoclosmatium globosum]